MNISIGRAEATFALLSLAFFMVTATTFSSLGVALPAMIETLAMSWTQAGLGFTILALFTGVFSPVAAMTLRRLGPRLHYATGGGAMALGFWIMAEATSTGAYYAATAILGAGFALLANVPGVFVIAQIFTEKRRAPLIGAYLAAGGLGGVGGPIAAAALLAWTGDWRWFWRMDCVAIAVIAAALVFALHRSGPGRDATQDNRASGASDRDRSLVEALSTRAFYVIGGALLIAYLCAVTVSAWAVAHLQALGLSASVAAAMLGLHAASNAGARAAGGFIVEKLGARTLLLAALIAELFGMLALAYAHSLAIALAFALLEGFAFGMILFATTVLQIDHFGLKNGPQISGAMNLFATAAMLGPVLAGAGAQRFGGFSAVFLIYAALAFAMACATGMFLQTRRQ